MRTGRLLIFALPLTAVICGGLWALSRRIAPVSQPGFRLLSGGKPGVPLPADKCVTCHQRETPAIVEQWARSAHARRQFTCGECHEVERTHPEAREHFGTYVSAAVTPATCGRCHPEAEREYARSRHGLPAWTALVGFEGLSAAHQGRFADIEEVRRAPSGGELPTGFVGATRNALYSLQGAAVTRMACIGCHRIGRPNSDGSAGNCNMCHLRHDFSLAQARKPETCNRCHLGPDHPQWEIYESSPHGILYHTGGHEWHWTQRPGRLGVTDFPAPTCQVCHMSGFGPQPTTHDVGDRLSWYLFAEISSHRPNWRTNRQRMKEVCRQCHSAPFVEAEYAAADALTEAVNARVAEAKEVYDGLMRDGLIGPEPFDDPVKFTAYNLWHHYGRTAKFGAWMQGPDYTQWHGYYPMLQELSVLKAEAARLREEHGATGAGAGR